ncbi:hypothetical protein C5C63_14630 [Rathayibacter sp. AY1B8]|nr:hypothetical protein C5C63_14630 [Rathayibacter sp. AY1B8]
MRLPNGFALPVLGRVVTRLHPTGYVDIGGVLVFVHSAATDAVIEGTVVLVTANRPTSAAVGDH